MAVRRIGTACAVRHGLLLPITRPQQACRGLVTVGVACAAQASKVDAHATSHAQVLFMKHAQPGSLRPILYRAGGKCVAKV